MSISAISGFEGRSADKVVPLYGMRVAVQDPARVSQLNTCGTNRFYKARPQRTSIQNPMGMRFIAQWGRMAGQIEPDGYRATHNGEVDDEYGFVRRPKRRSDVERT